MHLYIAGPDVFYPNSEELAAEARCQCELRGHVALCPVDNAIEPGPPGQMSKAIFDANVAMIRRADAVVANLSPFRGPSADAGTVWEVGFAAGLGKPIVGYTTDLSDYKRRVTPDKYMIEDFGGFDNLMITHSIQSVHESLENALDSLPKALSLMSNSSALTGCHDLIEALEECRAQGFIARFSGECTTLEKQVRLCRSAARAADRREHVRKAREDRKKVQASWDTIKEES